MATKDKSIFHTNPEEALNIGQDLKSKKVLGMHWGTVVLSLEDPFEPPVRFKNATNMYGYHKDDAIIFKIGEVQKLEKFVMKIENIKACVFDAYGTLFDVNSAAAKCKEKLGNKWEGFANAWRTTQLEYTWLRSLMKKHKNFWEITEDS